MRRAVLLLLGTLVLAGCFTGGMRADPTARHLGDGRNPFAAAEALVLAAPFTDLLVEIDYYPGAAPSEMALEDLYAVADALTLKANITFLPATQIDPALAVRAGDDWTLAETYAAHEATFGLSEDPYALGVDRTAFLHVLYLDDRLVTDDGTGAIGVCLGNTIVVYRSGGGPGVTSPYAPTISVPDAGQSGNGDRATLVHEFGHAIGLLNRGAPMVRPHDLPDDPAHSRNGSSVMHAGAELDQVAREFVLRQTARGVGLFDADDLADVEALREQGYAS